MVRVLRKACVAWSLLGLILAAGCSGEAPLAPVSGKVVVDGQPAESGSVVFSYTDGKTQAVEAVIGSGGAYSARVPVGKSTVSARVLKKAREVVEYPGVPNSGTRVEYADVKLEEKASGMPFEVTSAGGEFNIDVKSAK